MELLKKSVMSCKTQKQHYECSKPSYHFKTLGRNQTRHPVRQILNPSLCYHLVETGRAAGCERRKYSMFAFLHFWKRTSHATTVWWFFQAGYVTAAAILSPHPHIPSFPGALPMLTQLHTEPSWEQLQVNLMKNCRVLWPFGGVSQCCLK